MPAQEHVMATSIYHTPNVRITFCKLPTNGRLIFAFKEL